MTMKPSSLRRWCLPKLPRERVRPWLKKREILFAPAVACYSADARLSGHGITFDDELADDAYPIERMNLVVDSMSLALCWC